jgi:hypothetical protein
MKSANAVLLRPLAYTAAMVLVVSSILPLVLQSKVDAAQMDTRFIRMSNSATGATGVEYTVEFELGSSHQANALEGIIVDICAGDSSPLIGTACTAPASFSWGTPTVVIAQLDATGTPVDISGWTFDTYNSGRTLVVRNATGDNSAAVAAGTTVRLVLSGITNPSDVDTVTGGNQVGSFYGRVITVDDDETIDTAGEYVPTNGVTQTGYVDTGGIALSTTNNLTITARVQEKLTFCVYTGANCAAGGSSLTIGNGGVLSETADYHNADARFDVYTNARSGVVVRAKTFATPGHTLTSGASSINAIGAAAASTAIGTEQYGFCVATTGGSVTSVAPYNNANCSDDVTTGDYNGSAQFALDTASTQTTYGDDIASSGTATDTTVGRLNFLANIGLTTEAGIYQHELGLIATGTF